MNNSKYLGLSIIIFIVFFGKVAAQQPVTPNASEAAKDLLQRFYDLEGKGILTGMHNEQEFPTEFTRMLKAKNGNVELALWGNDYRYGSYIQFRQKVTDEAIRQWNDGKVITLLYHAPRPMDAPEAGWSSVQGEVSDAEWNDIITPGTQLYNEWLAHVDLVAAHLKQLEEAGVVVLFKPYHEMNGDWFWFGQKPTYSQLWKNLFDRYVNHHGLTNILWVFNVNWSTNMQWVHDPATYYPGHEYVDIIATDNYSRPWSKAEFDRLKEIGNGKPVAIGECETLPPFDKFRSEGQDYVWFMGWRQLFLDKSTSAQFKESFSHPYAINADNKFLTSTITGESGQVEEKLRNWIFPNPSPDGLFRVDAGTIPHGAALNIFSADGKLLLAQPLTWGQQFQLNRRLHSGVYFAILKNSQTASVRKLIVH